MQQLQSVEIRQNAGINKEINLIVVISYSCASWFRKMLLLVFLPLLDIMNLQDFVKLSHASDCFLLPRCKFTAV